MKATKTLTSIARAQYTVTTTFSVRLSIGPARWYGYRAATTHPEPQVRVAAGWYARILQHEIDHLGGTLYIDRMEARSFTSRENYERYWKNCSVAEFRKRLSAGASVA